jgi:hypothetical protein
VAGFFAPAACLWRILPLLVMCAIGMLLVLDWYFMFRVAKCWHKLPHIGFCSLAGSRLLRFSGVPAC